MAEAQFRPSNLMARVTTHLERWACPTSPAAWPRKAELRRHVRPRGSCQSFSVWCNCSMARAIVTKSYFENGLEVVASSILLTVALRIFPV